MYDNGIMSRMSQDIRSKPEFFKYQIKAKPVTVAVPEKSPLVYAYNPQLSYFTPSNKCQ